MNAQPLQAEIDRLTKLVADATLRRAAHRKAAEAASAEAWDAEGDLREAHVALKVLERLTPADPFIVAADLLDPPQEGG